MGVHVIKRFIIAFILLVIVCGGIVGFNMFRSQAINQFFATMKPPAVTVSTIKVAPQDWKPGIETIGTVAASRGVDLTVETTGIAKEILFTANQNVQQGDVLVQMDDAVQKANLAAQQTQASLDKVSLDRAVELQRRGVGSESTLDQARATASASASQVESLKAVLDQKQLRAPFSGTIGIPQIDNGQYLQPGTIVATLQNLETMRADFTVPEQRLSELKIGQSVQFGTTVGDLRYTGKITGIDPKVDPSSRLVSVRAEISNPDGQLSPGQFVQVRVELPEEQDVIALPQTAIISSLYGDYIYAVRPAGQKPAAQTPAQPATSDAATPADKAEPAQAASSQPDATPALEGVQVFVKTGRRSLGLVEILEGVKAGDDVVTAGQNRLSNGGPVKIDNTIDPSKLSQSGEASK
nr:efflux RND transporter periplasmic adaptor subunit [Oryzicola mucosus]